MQYLTLVLVELPVYPFLQTVLVHLNISQALQYIDYSPSTCLGHKLLRALLVLVEILEGHSLLAGICTTGGDPLSLGDQFSTYLYPAHISPAV